MGYPFGRGFGRVGAVRASFMAPAALVLCAGASADIYRWAAPVSGFWSHPSRWQINVAGDPSDIPDADDDVIIDAVGAPTTMGNSYQVQVADSHQASSVTIDSPQATLRITSTAELTVGSNFDLLDGAAIVEGILSVGTADLHSGTSMLVEGELDATSISLQGASSLEVSGFSRAELLSLESGSSLVIDAIGSLDAIGMSLDTGATADLAGYAEVDFIELNGGSALDVDGLLYASAIELIGSTAADAGGTVTTLTVDGDLRAQLVALRRGTSMSITGYGDIGIIDVSSTATLDISGQCEVGGMEIGGEVPGGPQAGAESAVVTVSGSLSGGFDDIIIRPTGILDVTGTLDLGGLLECDGGLLKVRGNGAILGSPVLLNNGTIELGESSSDSTVVDAILDNHGLMTVKGCSQIFVLQQNTGRIEICPDADLALDYPFLEQNDGEIIVGENASLTGWVEDNSGTIKVGPGGRVGIPVGPFTPELSNTGMIELGDASAPRGGRLAFLHLIENRGSVGVMGDAFVVGVENSGGAFTVYEGASLEISAPNSPAVRGQPEGSFMQFGGALLVEPGAQMEVDKLRIFGGTVDARGVLLTRDFAHFEGAIAGEIAISGFAAVEEEAEGEYALRFVNDTRSESRGGGYFVGQIAAGRSLILDPMFF